MPRSVLPLLWLLALAAALAGCGGKRESFLGTRVQDTCQAEWPICDRVAGCLLGGTSYLEGRFPGTRLVGVQVDEPSTVTMGFLLDDVGAAGEETALNFFEDRCRSRIRITIPGR